MKFDISDEISEQFEYLDEEDKEEKELDVGDDKIEDLEVSNEDLGVKGGKHYCYQYYLFHLFLKTFYVSIIVEY